MRKNFIYSILLCVLAILLQACSITSSVHFNRNYSGNYAMAIDVAGFMSFAMEFDSTATDEQDMLSALRDSLDVQKFAEELNAFDGVENSSMTISDGGVIRIAFDFEDIDALNTSFKYLNEDMMSESGGVLGEGSELGPSPVGATPFKRDGKTIIHSADYGDSPGDQEDIPMDMASTVEMMSSMIDYTIEVTTDRKIKSAEVTGLDLLRQEKKFVQAKLNFSKMMEEKGYSLSVRMR